MKTIPQVQLFVAEIDGPMDIGFTRSVIVADSAFFLVTKDPEFFPELEFEQVTGEMIAVYADDLEPLIQF
jgi:hypothetical protein